MATATAGELLEVGSHYAALDWQNGRKTVTKEEVYPVVSANWRGQDLRVTLQASRYVASDATLGYVWTPWNVYVYDVRLPSVDGEYPREANVTDTARRALRRSNQAGRARLAGDRRLRR